ncbi:spermidine/putrescine ABC transporter substrate-binding protein [Microtetraspora sp. NBRC 16547]|uniref:polyamine ABC transporter substrate-binding protein n=1 Tax=Microtetraspora sp. NBRC 16547 TaxID=3030993 RepID=UPI0024A1E72F|nr:spermidine/putrescine ABC transporter substrate-binding protein [Microtetraspora sp. NBRC 16547]GLX01336.1 spermidine/putrescine ABC transporter substrate-binding protein [Microtetraspora sp. NBRC 16547]
MSRTRYTRRLPAAAVVAGLALALAACNSAETGAGAAPTAAAEKLDPNADLSKQSLNITIWDGYSPEDLPKKVKDKFHFDVKVSIHDTNETAMAKLTATADSGFDVAFVSGQYAQALSEQGLLEPLHHELIPNLSNLYPEASELSYDKGNKFSVPYTWGTTGICYRSDLMKTKPTSWNDILDPAPEYWKKYTLMTTERWMALPALKALSFSINTTDDGQIAKAKELLVKAKQHFLAFDDTTFGDRLKTGEAVMVEAWDGWCPENEKNIEFVVPKEGSDLWADTMVILKSSKNKEAAHAFINYVLDPEIHSWLAENIFYKAPNKAAMEKVDPAVLEKFPSLKMTPAQLLQGESIIDLGADAAKFTRLATEVAAQQ